MNFVENYSLKHLNTFGVDIKAKYYARITHHENLRKIISSPTFCHNVSFVLGGGSNVLFVKDFPGCVLHMGIGGIEVIQENNHSVLVKAGGGVAWHELVLYALEKGYGGIENLSLIPGTVGAAPINNIGAYGVELKDILDSLEAMEVKTGKIKKFNNKECAFGYRSSIFKNELKGKWIIINATLRLQKQPIFNIDYESIRATLKERGVSVLSIRAISDAIMQIRKSKMPIIPYLGNAGSFFKNPIVSHSCFSMLKTLYPTLPSYDMGIGGMKLFAAWLIESIGWKGRKKKAVGTYPINPLIIVNYGDATGAEIYQFTQEVQCIIHDKFNIILEPEVVII